jgi:hypothetical protein
VRGCLRLVALIEAAGVVSRILAHLGVPAEVPPPRPARAPPRPAEGDDVPEWVDPAGFGFDT